MRQPWRFIAGQDPAPVDPASLAAAVVGSHQLAVRVEILLEGGIVANDLAVTDGEVTLDRRLSILGRCTASFAEPTRLPIDADGILSPFGYEARIWRGARIPGDGDHMVPLGTFPIQRSSITGRTLNTEIRAMDRSKLVVDAGFVDDYVIAAGTNYADAIRDLIDDAVSGLEYSFASTTQTTPLLVFGTDERDRWAVAQGMARAIGCELFFDGLGRCVLRPEPVADSSAPDLEFVEGDGGVLIDLDVDLDREPAFNGVLAWSSNPANTETYRALAVDDDPSSPTYWHGTRFRRKLRRWASPLLASTAQAQLAASTMLAANLGVMRSLRWAAVPDPRLEPGDSTLVLRAEVADEVQLLDAQSFGLRATIPMRGESRARQVA